MDWLDLFAVQGNLKSLLQHHNSKASILQCSAFFIVQLSHPYMTTGKTIALTRWTFVGKVMSLLFNMLSRLVITFLPRNSLGIESLLCSKFYASYFCLKDEDSTVWRTREVARREVTEMQCDKFSNNQYLSLENWHKKWKNHWNWGVVHFA